MYIKYSVCGIRFLDLLFSRMMLLTTTMTMKNVSWLGQRVIISLFTQGTLRLIIVPFSSAYDQLV